MLRLSVMTAFSLACLSAYSTAFSAVEGVERKGTPIPITPEFREKFMRETQEAIEAGKVVQAPDTPVPELKPLTIDRTRSDAVNLCFASIGPWTPWDGEFGSMPITERTWTCQDRDTMVKALGFTQFFLKGTGYVCSLTPLPQAQVAAKAFDIASFAFSGITLVVSVTKCENTLETKFDALLKACDELKAAGAQCLGVDNTPF
jgi:hypothetical protein